jgi:hypothetical protein
MKCDRPLPFVPTRSVPAWRRGSDLDVTHPVLPPTRLAIV